MPAISIYKSTTTYPAIPLSSSAITAFLYRKALPETRKKYSFFHHGTIKLLSALFLITNRPFIWSAIWDNIVIQFILLLINILGYDKYMKGYDQYIND